MFKATGSALTNMWRYLSTHVVRTYVPYLTTHEYTGTHEYSSHSPVTQYMELFAATFVRFMLRTQSRNLAVSELNNR